MGADQPRKREKEKRFGWLHFQELVLLARNDVNVISPEHDVLRDLSQKGWRRLGARVTNDSVQRRLHRPGRDLERLQEIGANSDGDDDCDKNNFDIFTPVRFPSYWGELLHPGVERFGLGFDPLVIAFL